MPPGGWLSAPSSRWAPENRWKPTSNVASSPTGGGGRRSGSQMPSASEAEDRGGPEHRLKDDEEATELDDALDDSFPASDPPSQTTKGRVK